MRLPNRLTAQESGFTLIELVVSIFVGVLVIGALSTAMIEAHAASQGNQRQIQLQAVLQQQIENVHQVAEQYGFSAVALSSNPSRGTDSSLPTTPTDPNDFITPYVTGFVTSTSSTSEKLLIEKNYDFTSEGTVDGTTTYGEELDVDPTSGKVSPVTYVDLLTGTTYASSSSVPSGDPYAEVHTYVTLQSEGTNSSLSCPATSGTGSTTYDSKRIVVAAKISTPHSGLGSLTPQWATTSLDNGTPSNQCQLSTGLRGGTVQ